MQKIERFVVYGLILALFIPAALFDFQISQTLYQPNNGFGQAFELIGQVPAYVFGAFGCLLISFFHPARQKIGGWIVFLLFLVLALALSVYGGYDTVSEYTRITGAKLENLAKWGVAFGIGAVLFGLAFLPTRFIRKENAREAFLFGVFLVAVMASTVLLMQVLKMLWLRPRYRTLVAMSEAGTIGDPSILWLPFYKPQFFLAFERYEPGGYYRMNDYQLGLILKYLNIDKWSREEFYAFPSGHTMNSFAFVSLCFLPNLFPKLRKFKRFGLIWRICAFVLVGTIAFSRIVRGAHHATDVLAGFFFALIVFDLGSTMLYQRFLRGRYLEEKESE